MINVSSHCPAWGRHAHHCETHCASVCRAGWLSLSCRSVLICDDVYCWSCSSQQRRMLAECTAMWLKMQSAVWWSLVQQVSS